MAQKDKDKDQVAPPPDAPPLQAQVTSSPEDPSKLEDTRPHAAIDEATDKAVGADADLINTVFLVEVNVPYLPTAEQVDEGMLSDGGGVPENWVDPSLVEVPGLGQFRNGTVNEVSAAAVKQMVNMFNVQEASDLIPPPGVRLREKNGGS